jgi:hypothetical protein
MSVPTAIVRFLELLALNCPSKNRPDERRQLKLL